MPKRILGMNFFKYHKKSKIPVCFNIFDIFQLSLMNSKKALSKETYQPKYPEKVDFLYKNNHLAIVYSQKLSGPLYLRSFFIFIKLIN